MISKQSKKSQAAMINNLVGDTSNTSKSAHTKNKQSTQSEHPQQKVVEPKVIKHKRVKSDVAPSLKILSN
jgi:hypothetical protein